MQALWIYIHTYVGQQRYQITCLTFWFGNYIASLHVRSYHHHHHSAPMLATTQQLQAAVTVCSVLVTCIIGIVTTAEWLKCGLIKIGPTTPVASPQGSNLANITECLYYTHLRIYTSLHIDTAAPMLAMLAG